MAATPFTEIRITDEVSAKYDNIRRSLRGKDQSVGFSKTIAAVKGLEDSVARLNQSFTRFLGLAGLSSLLSVGLVGGIARATRSMHEFAQSGLQLRYTAREIGVTTERLRYLTDAGRALGMSEQEARSGVVNLAKAMENLRTEGRNAKEFKELAQGKGGEELARKLIQIVNGPDGINRAMEYLATRTRTMDQRAQTSIKNIFGQPTVAWAEAFNVKGLHAVQESQVEDLQAYNLAWVNLGRTWFNTKATLGQAVIPAFQSLLTTTTQYLNGPGKGLVQQFAEWLRSIKPEDIRAFAKAVGDGINAFIEGVKKLWPLLQQIDKFVRENLGGWPTVLTALIGVGFVPFLGRFARALTGIGNLKWVVVAIGGLALLAPTAAGGAEGGATRGRGPGSGAGAGTGGGGVETLPEIEVTPDVPTPRPRPGRTGALGGGRIQLAGLGIPTGITLPDEEGNLPPRATLTSGTMTQQEISSLRQDRDVNRDLAVTVESAAKKVAALNDALSNLPLTDESGAGRIAAIAGAVRRGGGGGGVPPRGGGGPPSRGGGGRRVRGPAQPAPTPPHLGGEDPGGGGSYSRRPASTYPRQTVSYGGNTVLAGQRAALMGEMERDPALRNRIYALIAHESHGDMDGAVGLMETMVNRAMKLGHKSLWSIVNSNFYGPQNRGEVGAPSASEIKVGEQAQRIVQAGSNVTDFRDDQGTSRSGHPEIPRTGSGVIKIGNELFYYSDDANRQFANRMRRLMKTGATTPSPQPSPKPESQQPAAPAVSPAPAPADPGIINRVLENQAAAAARTGRIDPALRQSLQVAADAAGVYVDVFSGGQRMPGARGVTGTHRHDLGMAADFKLRDAQGRLIERNDPRRLKFLEEMAAAGAGASGAGYMQDPRSIHGGLPTRHGGLFPYAGSRAEREAIWRGIQRYRQAIAEGRDPRAVKPPTPAAVDPSIHKVLWTNMPDEAPARTFRGGMTRHQVQMKINIRGGRNVRVGSSSDNLDMKVEREKAQDPTGGGRIESPA